MDDGDTSSSSRISPRNKYLLPPPLLLLTKASIGSIQRALLSLENEGAEGFFGEPALELQDFLAHGPDGRGTINILAADRLIQSPKT